MPRRCLFACLSLRGKPADPQREWIVRIRGCGDAALGYSRASTPGRFYITYKACFYVPLSAAPVHHSAPSRPPLSSFPSTTQPPVHHSPPSRAPLSPFPSTTHPPLFVHQSAPSIPSTPALLCHRLA